MEWPRAILIPIILKLGEKMDRFLKIYHNYIHETAGEDMYIRYTSEYKIVSKIQIDGEYVFGHWFENVDIYNNIIVNASWDGIEENLVIKFHIFQIRFYFKKYN